jgi:phosphohistidine phosphatase
MNEMGQMKRLVLMRHAKSSWVQTDLPDFDRPLNSRGKHDAPLMAKRLRELLEKPDLILTSPAERAVKTVRAIAAEVGFNKKDIVKNSDIYLADSVELLKVLQGIDDSIARVLLCGHNPGLTNLCNFLANVQIENIPTCGVVCLSLAADSWADLKQGCGTLVYFDYPKLH